MRKGLVWTGSILLAAFVALAGYQYYLAQGRFEQDGDLVAELATAEFVPEPPVTEGDWPQWRGVRRDGHGLPFPLVEKWPARGPAPAWEVSLGEGWSTPVVSKGEVFYHFRADGNEVIRCVDLETGTQKWQQKYAAAANFEYSNGPRSTPCVADGKLFTVGINGRVQCRQTSDGELLWELDFPGDLGIQPPHRGVSFSPLVEDNLLLLNPGGNGTSVIACRPDTGKEVWRSGNDPIGYSSPQITTIAGHKMVIQFTGLGLVGLNLADGREAFSYPWPTAFQINAPMPILFQTRLGDRGRHYAFISTGYKQGCALLHLRPRQDGSVAVETVYKGDQFCSHFGSPVRIGDHVYGFDESRLVAMNLRTGEVRWRKGGFMKGTLCALGDQLVVYGEAGQIGIGPASPDTPFEPTLNGRLSREKSWSMPVVAQGRLLVRTEETGVCVDLRAAK